MALLLLLQEARNSPVLKAQGVVIEHNNVVNFDMTKKLDDTVGTNFSLKVPLEFVLRGL